jgi:hypothetical protein
MFLKLWSADEVISSVKSSWPCKLVLARFLSLPHPSFFQAQTLAEYVEVPLVKLGWPITHVYGSIVWKYNWIMKSHSTVMNYKEQGILTSRETKYCKLDAQSVSRQRLDKHVSVNTQQCKLFSLWAMLLVARWRNTADSGRECFLCGPRRDRCYATTR